MANINTKLLDIRYPYLLPTMTSELEKGLADTYRQIYHKEPPHVPEGSKLSWWRSIPTSDRAEVVAAYNRKIAKDAEDAQAAILRGRTNFTPRAYETLFPRKFNGWAKISPRWKWAVAQNWEDWEKAVAQNWEDLGETATQNLGETATQNLGETATQNLGETATQNLGGPKKPIKPRYQTWGLDRNKVKSLQQRLGVDTTGWIGPKTIKALAERLGVLSGADDLTTVKRILSHLGVGDDGKIGDDTYTAIDKFLYKERNNLAGARKLEPIMIVGPQPQLPNLLKGKSFEEF